MKNPLSKLEASCLAACRKKEREFHDIWLRTLDYHPNLTEYCSCLKDFTAVEWAILLSHNPDFIGQAPISKFSAKEWVLILRYQPQLEHLCACKDEFTAQQKTELQKIH